SKAAMAFSIQNSYPFYDRRLVEFCLALPVEQKIRGGWTRLVMRHAMGGLLPSRGQWRDSKVAFDPAVVRGMLRDGRQRMEEAILKDLRTVEPWVDTATVRASYERWAEATGGAGTKALNSDSLVRAASEARTTLRVVTLAWWLGKSGLAA